MKCRGLLILILFPLLAPSQAPAGILPTGGYIFGRKPVKPDPAQRLPELLSIVQTDKDENKRIDAVVELRQYEANAHPQLVPVLIQVLLGDKKPGVRSEAAQTLGKMRPVSQQVGHALEQARDNDSSMRVRLQARHSLLGYHWAGYKGGHGDEPPLAPLDDPRKVSAPPLQPIPLPPSTQPRLTPRPMPAVNPVPMPAPEVPLPPQPTVVRPPVRSLWSRPAPTPQPTAQPMPQPTAQPMPQPTAQPMPQPTAQPMPQPTAQPMPQPTAQPTQAPAEKSGSTGAKPLPVGPPEPPALKPAVVPMEVPGPDIPPPAPTSTSTTEGPDLPLP